jgi:hypothetical protein
MIGVHEVGQAALFKELSELEDLVFGRGDGLTVVVRHGV